MGGAGGTRPRRASSRAGTGEERAEEEEAEKEETEATAEEAEKAEAEAAKATRPTLGEVRERGKVCAWGRARGEGKDAAS